MIAINLNILIIALNINGLKPQNTQKNCLNMITHLSIKPKIYSTRNKVEGYHCDLGKVFFRQA